MDDEVEMTDRDLARALVVNAERFVENPVVPQCVREILRQVVESRRRPPAELAPRDEGSAALD